MNNFKLKKRKFLKQPFSIWFTGLSSTGKTTLSYNLKKAIKNKFKKIIVIDGDRFRSKIKNKKYDNKNRQKVSKMKRNFAKQLQKRGYNVIISGITPKSSTRNHNRKNLKNYIEILLECPLYLRIKRGKKNYQKAINNKSKHFVGLSKKNRYEDTKSYDLKLNTKKLSIKQSTNNIINHLGANGYI